MPLKTIFTATSLYSITLSQAQRLGSFVLCILLCTKASAYDPANDDIPLSYEGTLTLTGFQSRTAGNVQTYNIPISGYPSTLEVTLQGGDGGFAQSGRPANPTNQASKGGGGIQGAAQFHIHSTDPGALRPGGEIRVIPGSKGYDRQSGIYAYAVSGGGGGSGLLYRGPNQGDDWQPLIIAGGGGGAYASTVSGKRAANRHGGGGQSTESGQKGFGPNGFTGGTDGQGGLSYSNHLLGGGGGGWIGSGTAGGGQGYPVGGHGGSQSVNTDKGAAGGFGSGGGGDGGKVTTVIDKQMSGGGGGGYSGGGGGAHTYGGGGGGSYVTKAADGITPVANSVSWIPRGAGLKQQGFVSIRTFSPTVFNGALPYIIANDVTIPFSSTQPYIDQNVSAFDFYGSALTITTHPYTVDRSVGGVYIINYETQDRFGQKVYGSRRVIVQPGSNRPTFDLLTNLKVGQPGNQSHAVIANFNANWLGDGDAGFEELDRYEIIANDNPGAFQSSPTIANDGNLTFTPSIGTVQTATLTVIAIDNGPDPSVVESLPKQIEIQINMAPSEPVLDNDIVIEGTTFVGTVTSQDPEGETVTFQMGTDNDSSLFTINSDTGELSFRSPPDFENPLDEYRANFYQLSIQTNDGEKTSTESFQIHVQKEWYSNIAGFRAAYGLAPDGSDDFGDFSNNSVPNIYYHLFGMGDPNGPAQKSAAIGNYLRIPGMPRTVRNEDQTVTFFYTSRIHEEDYAVAPQLSSELAEWHLHELFPDDPNVQFKPIGLSVAQIGDHHQQVGLTFLTTATNPEHLEFEYEHLFFRLEIKPLPTD